MHRMHRMHPLLFTFDHFWRPLFDAFLRTVCQDGQKTITKIKSKLCQMTNSLAFWPTPPDRMRKAEAGPGSRAEGLKEEEPAPFHNGALARGTPDGAFNVGRRAPSRITPQH